MVDVRLPWPPSVNHYWGSNGHVRYLSPAARAWQKEAVAEIRAQAGRPRPFAVPVVVMVVAHPPDNRRRDLDNILKAVLDVLVTARIIEDDSLVHELHAVRRSPVGRRSAYVHVRVEAL